MDNNIFKPDALLEGMIISASGWRKIFAPDGNEESRESALSENDTILVFAVACSFLEFLDTENLSGDIVIACDTRPTGPAIAAAALAVLSDSGRGVRHIGVAAAPEIMAYAALNRGIGGFFYISASHNPVGHNGIKFGLDNGGVLDAGQADRVAAILRSCIVSERFRKRLPRFFETLARVRSKKGDDAFKREALRSYLEFNNTIFCEDVRDRERMRSAGSNNFKVIGELNGSARTLSIDREFLRNWGVDPKFFNDTPGCFTHAIVPEGESLRLCAELLEKEHSRDKRYQLGYVPDCDGDRGNLVYIREGRGTILAAQEVFALSVMSELAYLECCGKSGGKQAVVVNGPTSGRIERIAAVFDTTVIRAEVGEANVVNRARELRAEGYTVRILGEGSNGGNITYPAAVRDPLNTIGAVIRLMTIRDRGAQRGLFHTWCTLSGREERYRSDFQLSDVIDSLPVYTTTNAFSKMAKMQIRSSRHIDLKRRYEALFAARWKDMPELTQFFKAQSYEIIHYEGGREIRGADVFDKLEKGSGGYKIVLRDGTGHSPAFLWMRGSGTEPVFRVLVDCEGDCADAEKWLLQFHRALIESADTPDMA